MPNSHPTTTTEALDDGAAWLSVAAASAALGVSPKTVWRRARSGELTARKVAGERGAKVWEVRLDSTGQSNRTSGQTQPDKQAANRTKSPEIERKATGQTQRTPNGQPAKATGQTDTTPDDTGARFMAHLEAENKFLRAALEQRDRDAAELRAALRAALKLAGETPPPQLTAGDASASARDGPQRAPTGAAVAARRPATGHRGPQKRQ